MKELNVMLEKGKGPVLGKLRTMKLIEVDFQMPMRTFTNERMARKLKKMKYFRKEIMDR